MGYNCFAKKLNIAKRLATVFATSYLTSLFNIFCYLLYNLVLKDYICGSDVATEASATQYNAHMGASGATTHFAVN